MKKKIASIAIIIAFLANAAAPAFAQTASSSADLMQQLLIQIQTLKNQIETLQKNRQDVQHTSQEVRETLKLMSQLREGMTGDDVKLLQTTLAADSNIYPEGIISGFYGRLTAKAVRNFQKAHGLDQVGNVGPKTLQKLNEELDINPVATQINASGETEHCAIVPPGHLIAPGWLKKQDGVRPIVPECQTLPPGIANKLATSTPPTIDDTTPPSISSVISTGITTSSAAISWITNELSSGKVYYAATSPLNIAAASTTTNSALVNYHIMNLTALLANTPYYYVVESTDEHGNTATSSQYAFTTLPLDTTPPVLSSVTAANIASTTATVNWLTNEPSTGRVYYGTASPLNLSLAASVSSTALVTNHVLNLSGLTASTTYYFAVESKDAANNTATSSEQSFVTLP